MLLLMFLNMMEINIDLYENDARDELVEGGEMDTHTHR